MKSQKRFKKMQIAGGVLAALVFGLTGIALLVSSRAATSYVAAEADAGSFVSPAAKISDTSASGGSAARFNAPASGGSVFSFVSIPDTQRELGNDTIVAKNFNGRLNWLVQNRSALNLSYVWQVGDLQDTDNLIFSSDKSINPRYIPGWPIDHYQYDRASTGLKILDRAQVPYTLTIGNHDTGAVCGGPACPVVAGQTQPTKIEVRNTSTWNMYYTPSRYPELKLYEANKTDNSYRIFQQGGLTWMVLSLELWPRTEVITWAKTVVAANPKANVIITTHSYLNGGGGIEQTNGGYGANSPQYLFDNLVKVYPNVRMVFSGHVGDADFRTDTGTNGNTIYSFGDCYHDNVNNWMRILTMDTIKNTISTKVYSPLTNATRSDTKSNINLSGISWVR